MYIYILNINNMLYANYILNYFELFINNNFNECVYK